MIPIQTTSVTFRSQITVFTESAMYNVQQQNYRFDLTTGNNTNTEHNLLDYQNNREVDI